MKTKFIVEWEGEGPPPTKKVLEKILIKGNFDDCV